MNTLPNGYIARPARPDDVEVVVDTLQAYSRKVIGIDEDTVESIERYWQSPGFQLSTDSLAIFTHQGQVAGYSEFWDWGAPHVRLIGWSCVHPDHWRRGLGGVLLDWSIERARQNVGMAPEDAKVVLQHFAASTNPGAAGLFTGRGFRYERSQYVMGIDFEKPPQPAALPDDITIRAINGEEELRGALFAAHQAFKDHYGNANGPFEEYYQRTRQRIAKDPHFDPSLWFIALDQKEITGVSLCSLHTDEDPNMAWVGTLGVLRPWRKRGIGLALLQVSFEAFYRRGKARAGLGVDASNLTGAVKLYERAGMRVLRQNDIYELELRSGKDIMKRSMEEPSKAEEK